MPKLIIGARGSKLSVAQTKATLIQLKESFPDIEFELKTFDTTGDIDQASSLTAPGIADNFFSDSLDRAVLDGTVDAAIHSAKDLPDYHDSEIDWFHLPWIEDRRDAVLYPQDKPCGNKPVVGISSPNREEYAKKRWPGCIIKPIRGNIDSRIQQMDQGDFDVILLAVAGLNRLGFDKRISEIISMDELPTHAVQGTLGVTFKRGHKELNTLRQILTHPVILAGAGTGREGHYSLAVKEALEQSDICLHDALLNKEILSHAKGEVINVGKRYSDGNAKEAQTHLVKVMLDATRAGKKVVRLKGGDPSLFGRLSEELSPLYEHALLFKVLPGIPWICSAPIRHGIYLTSREETRHFQVATGTEVEGKTFDSKDLDPTRGPIYFFMALNKIGSITKGLIEKGYAESTPCAVFREDAGSENIVRGTLKTIEANLKSAKLKPPGLLLVGESAAEEKAFNQSQGPLAGKRVLCPGSEVSRLKLTHMVEALGGEALPLEVFKLTQSDASSWIDTLKDMDYLVLASGSAVEILMSLLKKHEVDLRNLPSIVVSGPSAANTLKKHGLYSDFMPKTFTSEALANELIQARDIKNKKVLVARSDASRSPLPKILEDAGAKVFTETLYHNQAQEIVSLPKFDAVCFCSPSSVEVLHKSFPTEIESANCIASIGPVTTKALQRKNLRIDVEPAINDAQHLVWALTSKLHWT